MCNKRVAVSSFFISVYFCLHNKYTFGYISVKNTNIPLGTHSLYALVCSLFIYILIFSLCCVHAILRLTTAKHWYWFKCYLFSFQLAHGIAIKKTFMLTKVLGFVISGSQIKRLLLTTSNMSQLRTALMLTMLEDAVFIYILSFRSCLLLNNKVHYVVTSLK